MTLDRESARRAVEEYWLERLSGDSPKISLPILNEKRAAGSTDQPVRAFLQLAIADHIAARLKDIGSHGEVALLVLFLSGLNILLHKYTGVEDVVIGTMSVREEGVKDKIIFCRNHVSGAFTTREFIRRTKANVLEDFNHGDYAFGALYQKLLSTHNADRLELFNVALIYDRLQRKSALLDQFDLVLTLSAQDNGLLLGAEYRSNLYEGDMIQHFCQNLIDFFDRLPDNLDISISHLDVVGAREKEMWLDFNRTQEEFPHDRTIPELFERQVGEKPDGIALRGAKAHQVSYGELNRRANQLARLLRERGVSSGSIVAVMINRSAEMVMALLGILKAGAAYLPIDPQVPRERILTMLKDSDASIVLTEKGVVARNFYTFLQGINDITAEPHFTSPRQQIMNLDHLPIPDRSLVDYETYSRYIGQVMVKNTIALQTARGCPYRCAYCSKIWGKKHVFRSADDVFKEMQTYYDMGVRRFSIFDDIFNLNSENGIRLFELIIRHGLEVQLFFPNGLRGDLLTRDYIDLLVEAGLTTTALALETASPRLQKLINKNLDLDQFRRNAGYFCTRYPQVILELFTIPLHI
jgi:hypothetical protein